MEIISQALAPRGHAFAQELLEERVSRAPMKDEDRRLAADLAYGVIRRLGTLDAILSAYSELPLSELEPAVLQILRLGLYQLLCLERVPAHAAVDESVRLARATGKARATGFINAILRTVAREVTFSERPDPARPRHSFELVPGRACTFGRPVLPAPADTAGWLAAALSFPRELIVRWLARYGNAKTRELCAIANEPAPTFVRPNALRVSLQQLQEALRSEDIAAVPSPSARTLRLPIHVHVARLRAFKDGLFMVQDDSSAAVAPFLGPQPGESILDLCAAPGGKTCHIAELMQNRGIVAAVDASARRLQLVVENVQRLDLRIVATIEADGAKFALQHRGKFDRVLLDAPCSNTGVLRRRVEARWRFSAQSLAGLVARQQELLRAGLECLRPGGVLVYSTCSLEPEENGGVVLSVLRGASGLRLEAEEQILPSRDGGDGIYMARIRKDKDSPVH